MNNKTLINKVYDMWYEKLNTREQSERVMCQISIIRRAFNVKEFEIVASPEIYERERAMSDEQVHNQFMEYVGFWKWANEKASDKVKNFENKVFYFVDGVKFFDTVLGEKLENEFRSILQTV